MSLAPWTLILSDRSKSTILTDAREKIETEPRSLLKDYLSQYLPEGKILLTSSSLSKEITKKISLDVEIKVKDILPFDSGLSEVARQARA